MRAFLTRVNSKLQTLRRRGPWLVLHRWAGLATALFLFIAGATGAIISWDHELDDLLNPHLMRARSDGAPLPALELVRLVEERYPHARVTFFPLATEPGESFMVSVRPRVDPTTGKLFELDFDQVFLDPATGEELGKRLWGAVWPITKENLISFLYKLHYSLHLPEIWGTDRWGVWLMGAVALVWTLDCFVGFYLTLPARRRAIGRSKGANDADSGSAKDNKELPPGQKKSWWQRWKPAWRIRVGAGAYKLNFDFHRAVSLWTWGLLLIIAFTAFSLNLYREVFYPLMSTVSQVTPTPFDLRTPTAVHEPITPQVSFRDVIERARSDARQRGWTEPIGSVFYGQHFGVYSVQFYHPGADHGVGGAGHRRLYYDALDGRLLGERKPWSGTAADLFIQAQFPLHSGRILGLPGRALISLMGLVVAMISVTGVYIWWRKREARWKAASQYAAQERIDGVPAR